MDKEMTLDTPKRNRYTFGIGTIGRDMVYTLMSMYLMYYLTEALNLSTQTLWWVTGIMMAGRIIDAVNDPVMGVIVDNTHSRFGKFKPWIAIGAFVCGIVAILLFTNFNLVDIVLPNVDYTPASGAQTGFLIVFAILYLMWDVAFTPNDIAYWSMLPSLSIDQKEREKIGAIARICANIGLFAIAAGIEPITSALTDSLGSLQKAYFVVAIAAVAIMWLGQCVTLFGVKQVSAVEQEQPHTSVKEMFGIIFKNDQLAFTALAMALFMIGYCTTTGFGLHYFTYIYGDKGMYSIFALILGVSQIAALAVFPLFSKKFDRKTLFTAAIILVIVGYVVFFFAPTNTMIFIGIAGLLLFVGQAFIQLLMLMFLADSVDYGQWKLGKRNDSVSFSIQPFINKMGGAVGSGVLGATLIIAGINNASSAADVTDQGKMTVKIAMLALPLICIVASYFIYRAKYKIDKKMYDKIWEDLKARGEMAVED